MKQQDEEVGFQNGPETKRKRREGKDEREDREVGRGGLGLSK